MRTRRLLFAATVAVIIAFAGARIYAAACHPFCGLYDPWQIEYYWFQCWECSPPPPEG